MSSPLSVSNPSDAAKENRAVKGNSVELVQATAAETRSPTEGNTDGTTETDNGLSNETNALIRSDVQSSSSERFATTTLHSNVSEAPEKAEYTEQGICREDVMKDPGRTAFVETMDSTSVSLLPLYSREETKNEMRYVFATAESFVTVADQRRSVPNGTDSSKSKPTRVPSEKPSEGIAAKSKNEKKMLFICISQSTCVYSTTSTWFVDSLYSARIQLAEKSEESRNDALATISTESNGGEFVGSHPDPIENESVSEANGGT